MTEKPTMKPITVDDPESRSTDLVAENIARLKSLFPEIVTKGPDGAAINEDILKQLVGDKTVTDAEEKYGLNWHGKRKARQLALTPSSGTLRPCPEESVDWETTQNLFIEGDNLEVLKLLQKSYANKVKLIYIDPPYNTGKDYVYRDDYRDNIQNYKAITGQIDSEGKALTSNTETSGRFHTDWLNMLLPRLKLAKSLLKRDGVIFISIDDEEVASLKLVCDEIFGEENYVNTISINMKNVAGASGGGEDKRLKKNIEYMHIYARDYDSMPSFENAYDFIPIGELVQTYREDGRSWKYTSILVDPGDKIHIGSTVDGEGNQIQIYARRNPIIKSISQIMKDETLSESDAYSKYADKIFQTAMPQSSIRPRVMERAKELGSTEDLHSIEYVPKSGRNKGVLYEQFYKGDAFRLFAWLRDVAEEIDGVLHKKELKGTYWDYASETKNLTKEGQIPFQNGKKPLAMLKRLLSMQIDKDFLVLDFFAGSASMAHAVMLANLEDSGNRRFMMVQLPEPLDPKKKEHKDSYEICREIGVPSNVSELGKERIRRAGQAIREDNPLFKGDTGFRVFKLDTSNIRAWNPDPDDLEGTLQEHAEHLAAGRSEADVLYELLLKLGLDLAVAIETRQVDGNDVHAVGAGTLFVCLAESISRDDVEALAQAIIDWHKELAPEGETTIVFRDSAFADDVAKSNIAAILVQAGFDGTRIRSL